MQISVAESKSLCITPSELFEVFKDADDFMFEDEHPQGRVMSMFIALNNSDKLIAEHLDRFCNIDMLVAFLEDTGAIWVCEQYEVDLYEH